MKTIIVANHHTTQRMAVAILMNEDIRFVMVALNEKYGGSWVYVQDLTPYHAVAFEAIKVYHGFDNNPENDYCGNIINVITASPANKPLL